MIETAGSYRFTVKSGKAKRCRSGEELGTKLSHVAQNFKCVMSGTPIAGDYIKAEGKSRAEWAPRLMAIVAEGERGRMYLSATDCQSMKRPRTQGQGQRVEAGRSNLVADARAFTRAISGHVQYGLTKLFVTFSHLGKWWRWPPSPTSWVKRLSVFAS